MTKETAEGWSSRIGVIMAVAGSAVGLGNFLRFPGKAYENGGGAFMIPYFVALLLLGIPLCWAEWSMGRYGGGKGFNSGPGIFTVLWRNPLSKYFGTMTVLIPLCVYFYYIVIESWCLMYAWDYLTGALMQGNAPDVYKAHFATSTGEGGDGVLFGIGSKTLIFVGITFLINFLVVFRGLSGGIEKFCNIAMPLMALCAVCVLVRVLTLGTPDPALPDQNVLNGLGKMWNPPASFSDTLLNPKTWLAAAGQIFFTLSVGFGVIIHYASYVKKNDDVALSSITASSVNEFFEVCLGGLITITAAFIFLGANIASYTSSSFSLGFNALPNVFASMPGGQFFGFVWFFMLFLAAITSSLSMLQPVNAFFKESLAISQTKSIGLLAILTVIGTGYIVYFSKGLRALDAVDFWAGEFFIVVLAIIQAIFYGWILGVEKGKEELDRGAQFKIPGFVQFILKYVTPLFLLVLLVTNFISLDGKESTISKRLNEAMADPVIGGALGLVIGSIILCMIISHFGEKRWKAEGRYKNL